MNFSGHNSIRLLCMMMVASIALFLMAPLAYAGSPGYRLWTLTAWDDSIRMVSVQMSENYPGDKNPKAEITITMIDIMGNRFEQSMTTDKLWYEPQEEGGTLWMDYAFIRTIQDGYIFHARIKDMSVTLTVTAGFAPVTPFADGIASDSGYSPGGMDVLIPRGTVDGYLIRDSVPYTIKGWGAVDRLAVYDTSVTSHMQMIRMFAIDRQNTVLLYAVADTAGKYVSTPEPFAWAGGMINPPLATRDIRLMRFEYPDDGVTDTPAHIILALPDRRVSITSCSPEEGLTSGGMTLLTRQPLGAKVQQTGFGHFSITTPRMVEK